MTGKDCIVAVRVTHDERELIRKHATLESRSMSSYLFMLHKGNVAAIEAGDNVDYSKVDGAHKVFGD